MRVEYIKGEGVQSSSDEETMYAKIHIWRYSKEVSRKSCSSDRKMGSNDDLKILIILHEEKVGILVQIEEK